MRNFCRPVLIAVFSVAVFPVLAHAHPGHDDHEFTWDFSHLMAHPWATLGCAAILVAGGWVAWRFVSGGSKPATKM